jgi:predicted transcriptional regulator
MMAKDNLHRVFVVDAGNRPIDCISQTDVLRFVADGMREGNNWWA